ncbi:hypothetical protein ABH930_006737 [Kitasatospora sp. GAS204A]|nr:hypothetical protein [Kitasatospora sp. GAS204B]
MTDESAAALGEVLARLLPQLDERQPRLTLGPAARMLGYGDVRRVARLAGGGAVHRGARELDADQEPADRVRAAGASRCVRAIRAW